MIWYIEFITHSVILNNLREMNFRYLLLFHFLIIMEITKQCTHNLAFDGMPDLVMLHFMECIFNDKVWWCCSINVNRVSLSLNWLNEVRKKMWWNHNKIRWELRTKYLLWFMHDTFNSPSSIQWKTKLFDYIKHKHKFTICYMHEQHCSTFTPYCLQFTVIASYQNEMEWTEVNIFTNICEHPQNEIMKGKYVWIASVRHSLIVM